MNKLVLRFLVILSLMVFLATTAFAQITKIRDIQFTEDASGDTPLKDQVVTIQGIVTSEHRGTVTANGGISNSYFFVMDTSAAWSGIQIFYNTKMVAEGDRVSITGKVSEYNGQTQIGSVTDLTILSSGNPVPGPVMVTTAEVASEAFECCLVQVNDVTISETGIGNFAEWKVDDGSGAIKIGTRAKYYFKPVLNAAVKSVAGIVMFSYGVFVIEPRLAWDVVESSITRIQRIQQVRNSDLLKAPVNQMSDISYMADPAKSNMAGDTATVRGIVTMPTGLSYAGAGIKFILSEIGGGPWSSVLSYHPDSTAYPTLFEGDVVEMTGYVGEYRTGSSNMTEFWITSPINIIDFDQPLPKPDYVKTGDLRLPVTAEQWGNVMVHVKNAKIINVNPAFECFEVDDGSGSVLVDDDSDSMRFYGDPKNRPPLGTTADSIRGWIYHHFGVYTDSSTYKLEPLYYLRDVVWGSSGPPAVSNVLRNVGVPKSTDTVTITAEINANLPIQEVTLNFNVNSTFFRKVIMTSADGIKYTSTISPQANGSFVNYYIEATDNIGQKGNSPADIKLKNFAYKVTDGPLMIKDVQFTPFSLADSPYEGYKVAVTGIISMDSSHYSKYRAYSLQDANEPWSGIFAFGISKKLNRGDEVTVYGTVTDYNDDYHFKWDNNTVILADSVKILSSGNVENTLAVKTGSIADNNRAAAELYEGMIVKIQNATLVKVNRYDATFDDGSGPCLIDGDFMLARDQDPNTIFHFNQTGNFMIAFGDTLRPGDKVDMIQGVFVFSFGTFKIEIRDANDFGDKDGVNPNYKVQPLAYELLQNYPNPFNPETRISFEIPQAHQVKLVIYNVLGQKVRTLTQEAYEAGRHIVNWDGRDDLGRVVPSGVYLYRLKAGDYLVTKRMLMLK
jgi:DNA/RNA endonuclease YhcR with UshA esterase domain